MRERHTERQKAWIYYAFKSYQKKMQLTIMSNARYMPGACKPCASPLRKSAIHFFTVDLTFFKGPSRGLHTLGLYKSVSLIYMLPCRPKNVITHLTDFILTKNFVYMQYPFEHLLLLVSLCHTFKRHKA